MVNVVDLSYTTWPSSLSRAHKKKVEQTVGSPHLHIVLLKMGGCKLGGLPGSAAHSA